MTTKQFKLFQEEQNYILHLKKVLNESSNVCNRIDCTKHEIVKKDREAIHILLSTLIANTKDRMDNI